MPVSDNPASCPFCGAPSSAPPPSRWSRFVSKLKEREEPPDPNDPLILWFKRQSPPVRVLVVVVLAAAMVWLNFFF
jgi:hypothetical protein